MPERFSPRGGGSPIDDRRRRLVEHLQGMSDDEFAAVVRSYQRARWRAAKLAKHAREHARDFAEVLARPLARNEIAALSQATLRSWERLFVELEPSGHVSYIFASRLTEEGDILLVATRRGLLRTAIPMRSIDRWVQRHGAAVEVTDRAKKLGL